MGNFAAICHRPSLEDRYGLSDGRVSIRLHTAAGDFARVMLCHAGNYATGGHFPSMERVPMQRMWCDGVHDVWEAVFLPNDPRLVYCFEIFDGETSVIFDSDGVHTAAQEYVNGFHYAHAYPAWEKPLWARGTVGYQIFADRFCRASDSGDVGPNGEALEPWGSRRIGWQYRFGGDLRGILSAVPYLAELGVTIVYLTPIFLSDTSHRYNVYDYFRIDPLLGGLEDLRALTAALHARGMRLVLDGVFNHCGVQFQPFADALRRGKDSPFYGWFAFDERFACGYMTFAADNPYMPKMDMRNPDCAAYFLDVCRYWLREADIDGWRLDVSPEVYPDFWRQYRRAAHEVKPDAVLIAECWDDAREWCNAGDMFDGTMHYVLSGPIWHFFAEHSWTLAQFDAGINRAMALYPQEVQNAMWTFISSHDTERMLTRCGGDSGAMRAAAFFQMTHPGVPVIYYGDELGMRGGFDPGCRGSMTWKRAENSTMLAYYRRLTAMRNRLEVLREGTFVTHEVGEDGLYSYIRKAEKALALCVLCTGERVTRRVLDLPDALAGETYLTDALTGRRIRVRGGRVTLTLARYAGIVLTKTQTA